MSSANIEALAERLDTAWRTYTPIPPLSESEGISSVETAYAIQAQWTAMRLARGEKVIGRKIGLTSQAIQQQLGVNEPDYGTLWQSSYYLASNGRVEIPASDFLQPRIEGEVAFLIGKSLPGPNVTARDVLAATEACALGVEIVASRIADWRIKLVDTIADNASYGGFTLGPWDRRLPESDLSALAMTIEHNGVPAAEGVGAAALGHPAAATAWLANKLLEFGVSLEPGDIVISGGITRMLPVRAGDQFLFSLTRQPSLMASFR
ncbi:MAG: fumarylacetoacetate hydrolase family protein [Chloroflexi bacterium]|nr:fumarylacetoacetate hydrolase family protein [Chloroflexota bacterium]MCI0576303.1 fumarylacetoacetate hydrolase family protein [Chloroflexota bacterium]MCI0650028.1 fumarylacetoacetate hydrolase family protein [Chloroflexota bacterium]MCI0730488.1 fumarylacetoacetate hydrolase family protein [Chloroflexota bacterium]